MKRAIIKVVKRLRVAIVKPPKTKNLGLQFTNAHVYVITFVVRD